MRSMFPKKNPKIRTFREIRSLLTYRISIMTSIGQFILKNLN